MRVPFCEHVASIEPSWDNFNAAIAVVCACNYWISFDELFYAVSYCCLSELFLVFWFLLSKVTIETCPIFLSGKARTQFPSLGDKLTSPS